MSAISVENLSFSFGSNQILNGICIEIDFKQIYALLGPSGGGKTTLLRLILGTVRPREGSVRVMDEEPGLLVNGAVSYMPQDCALCSYFSINQTMNYFKNIYRLPEKEFQKRYKTLKSILRLPDCQLLVSQLSGGGKRRLSIAVALINRPSIVVLDEPTVGMDPLVRQQIWEFLKNECKRGMTAIIVTHYVEEAVAADRVGLMRNGRILAEDSPQNLMQMFATNSLEEVFLRLCLTEEVSKDTKRMALYKTRNKYTNIGNDFDYDFNNNPKDVNCFSRLKISLWLILIVIHKNVHKFSNLSISLIIILLPATQAFLFCLIYSKPLIQLKTAVVNEELDPNYSTRLLSSLVSSERHIIQAVNYSSLSEAIESVKTTRSVAALRIPKYFSEAIDTRITEGFNADNQTIIESTISVYIDNSVIMYSRGVINSLTESLISFLSDIYSENGKTFKGIAISFEKTENSKNLMINNYYLPAFYLYYLYMSQITLSSLLLTQERKDGLFERSLIAGVSHEVVFISHLITNCLLALIQILLLYVMGFMLFNVINNSSLPLLFSYLFLECLNAISFGLLISSLVDREIVSVIIVWFVTLPQLFCSGLFYPLEAMNPLLKTVFYYLSSLSIPIETMRNLVLRGWHLNNPSLSFGFLWSIVPSLVCLVIAMVIFKRK